MSERPIDTLTNAWEKTQLKMLAYGGKVFKAFDELDVGYSAHLWADWFHGRRGGEVRWTTGKVIGACLSCAMMAVEADRRSRASNPILPEGEWTPDPKHEELWNRNLELSGIPRRDTTFWRKAPLRAVVDHEPIADGELRWHISVSHTDRVPTWEEFAGAVHELRPGVMFCVPLPPPQFWLNLNERVLHVYEIRDEPLTDVWKRAGRGDLPT